jgi:hypothetical protein
MKKGDIRNIGCRLFSIFPAAGAPVGYAQIGLNAQFQLKKIGIDNNTRFRYQVGYWCFLIEASICGAAAKADTEFAVFA